MSAQSQKTQLDTEAAEASRRGIEFSIGANATTVFTQQMNPDFPRPDPQVFLRELLFVLCGLCECEIGLRNLS
jgi:hypothetical protein